MKPKRLTTVALLLYFAFFSVKSEENNASSEIRKSSDGTSTANENTDIVLMEEEVLEKWKNAERILKDAAPKVVKDVLRFILTFSGGLNISSRCTKSQMKMLYGIKQLKLWAYKMIDASGKIPNGILNGHLSSLGDFDGCLSVNVPGPNPFRGRYCSVFMNPPLPKRKPFLNVNKVLPLFANFTKKGTLMDYAVGEAHQFYRVSLRTSVCMPSACSREDIQKIADNIVTSSVFTWNVTVPTCDVIEPLVFNKSDIAITCVLCVVGLLALTASTVDIILNMINKEKRTKVEESSTVLQCLMCFSAYSNTLRLLKRDTSPDSINIFHGMKVITLLWVMLNHTYYFMNFSMTRNLTAAREFGREIAFQMIANGFLNVETFFFISAVLVAYGRMKYMEDHISIPLYIFRRIWRLTPTLMLVIATSFLIPHMGSGPGWKETVGEIIDNCRENWWTNLFFVNNFVKTRNTCFEWLWYVPVDMHLYILSLLVIIPLKSRPKLAYGINVVIFIFATVVTAAGHVYYEHQPTAIYVFTHPDDIHHFTENSYYRSYTHITTCCIGLYVGYILATKPEMKIPWMLNIIGWFSSLTLALVVLYGVYDWNQGNVPSLTVSTIYMCTNKVVWALALSYVTIACFTGNGGVITSLLSWSAFVPLSRLTYVAYLIHPLFQFMYVGSTRIPLELSHKSNACRFLQTVLISYAFAYVISLLFESPFIRLEKVIFSRRRISKDSFQSEAELAGKLRSSSRCISTIQIRKIDTECFQRN